MSSHVAPRAESPRASHRRPTGSLATLASAVVALAVFVVLGHVHSWRGLHAVAAPVDVVVPAPVSDGHDPSVPAAVANVASAVGPLLQDQTTKPNPHLAFQDLSSHGASVVSVDAEAFAAELLFISSDDVKSATLPGSFEKHFRSERLRVKAGSRTLERAFTDGFYSWDVISATWLPS